MLIKLLKNLKKYKKIGAILVIVLIFIYFIKILYQNFLELPSYDWEMNYTSLFISYIFLLFYFAANVLVWRFIIKNLNIDKKEIPFKTFFKIYFLPYLSKYIPGKIWAFMGRIYLAQKQGLSKFPVSLSIIWEQIFALISATLLFLFSLFFWEKIESVNYIYLVIFILFLFFIGLNSSIYNKIVNLIIKKFNKNNSELKINLSRAVSLKFIGLYCIVWMIFGVSFYFFIDFIYKIPARYFFLLLGLYPASWVLGTLSFLTPSGIGITEGVLVALLAFYFPLPVAIIISLSSRIWLSFGELICFGIAATIDKSSIKKS